MGNPNTFDEASAASQELFDNDRDEQTSVPDDNGTESAESTAQEEGDASEAAAPVPESELEQAAQTAETAAQVASDKDTQLQQALGEIESIKQQNEQLRKTIEDMSKANEEAVVSHSVEEPPTLDFNSLAFADEATQAAALKKFSEDMAQFNRRQIMDELAPTLDFAKKGMRDAERNEVIGVLSQIPELHGIQDMLPQLDRIIESNKWLQSDEIPLDEKYINAYTMAKGISSMSAPAEEHKAPTNEELLAFYNSNPEFREMVEKQRIESIKQGQQVPTFSASSGAGNAALNIKEKPQTLDEASRRTREMFGEM